jgi:7-cyano-7-deazaguanine synthase in queuosine biosynthesis
VKVACSQSAQHLATLSADAQKVLLFSRSDNKDIGSIGAAVKEHIEKHKHLPEQRAWDFVALGLSVYSADQIVHRNTSPDGWTREIELTVSVADPDFWNSQKDTIDAAFQFLTTDRWSISFEAAAERLATPEEIQRYPETSVSLLSGGMDSLIGAVDLAADNEKALLTSQVAPGDRGKQQTFATEIGLTHLQLTHGASFPGDNEPSTRSRSIVFIVYGVMAATLLESYGEGRILLRVPENGFVSINPPLTDARLGGLSTRTTHPVFIHAIQSILDAADLRVELMNPYQLKTKGEMLKECKNQQLIKKLASESTSCGRFARTGWKHCGRCVPCLVRRAAFYAAGMTDATDYKYDDLGKDDDDHARFDDVRSAAMAVAMVQLDGLTSWIGASLVSAALGDPAPYRESVGRGIAELGMFLKRAGVK